MASKDTDSRMQKTKTDAFIQDYLSDVWGDMLVPKKDAVKEKSLSQVEELSLDDLASEKTLNKGTQSHSSTIVLKNTERVKKQFSLIPTIKILSCSEEQVIRSQTESTIILLTNLYFLRRPLSPKVRQFILNLSEQVIDDFHAAYWLHGTALKEVCHEI